MSCIADVGACVPSLAARSLMSRHTSPWSEAGAAPVARDALTWACLCARPRGSARARRGELRRDVVPPAASTQETGMVSTVCAGTRMVRLTTRFCLAPTNSSPSSSSTGVSRSLCTAARERAPIRTPP